MSQSEDNITRIKGKLKTLLTPIFRLIWRDTPPKPVKEEGEITNGVNNVNLGETKREEGVKAEAEKARVVENGGDGAPPPRAPTPVLHSYS